MSRLVFYIPLFMVLFGLGLFWGPEIFEFHISFLDLHKIEGVAPSNDSAFQRYLLLGISFGSLIVIQYTIARIGRIFSYQKQALSLLIIVAGAIGAWAFRIQMVNAEIESILTDPIPHDSRILSAGAIPFWHFIGFGGFLASHISFLLFKKREKDYT